MLAIKVDNTRAAQPHTGLQAADLVYVTEVEWDLTRFIAVYNSTIPDVIGPVRSARISDIDILAPFGKIAFSSLQPIYCDRATAILSGMLRSV